MLKIDTHTHIMPEVIPNWSKEFGYGKFIHLEHHRKGFASMMQGNAFFREIEENCWNAELRINEYEKFNTQVQVVCTIPVLFAYWAKPEHTLAVSEFLNNHIAEIVSKYPKNYVGLATLPMNNVAMAVSELERCKKIGFKGIQIGSNINQVNLSDVSFEPLWKKIEELDMCVMVHPWEMMGESDMKKYWLPWLVGMPAETARAIASLIFSGVLERYNKIRFLFAHAGGSFIPTIGRLEHGFNCRPDLVAIDNTHSPKSYLKKFWVDSATHDSDLFKYILSQQGSSKIALGTDYPFPLGDLQMGEFIEKMNLETEDLENIMFRSALNWLNMKEQDFQ
jgi:aminocarboxymuconate-semialdehyde decarboxylase